MNFTKEYIKKCDCREIQKLRPDIKLYDWVNTDKGIGTCSGFTPDLFCISSVNIHEHFERKKLIWLPTGDQLDDEIVKICNKVDCTYHVNYSPYDREWIIYTDNNDEIEHIPQVVNSNPLIAKIKLLKELLKENQDDR